MVSEWELNQQKQYMERVQLTLHNRYGDQLPLAHVHSYGCQQNVSDGEKLKGMLAQMGYGFCDTPQDANLVLYNTCAVRKNAEDRVFGNVGALKNQKRNQKGMLIGLCGCMMQQPHIVEQLKQHYPYVDLVFGTHALHLLPQILYQALQTNQNIYHTQDSDGMIAEDLPIRRDGTIKAWVPIMYGCNHFCTYCIVPYVRGRERSRTPEAILTEIRGLIAEGFKEITLLGQNVNSYGKGLTESTNFSDLLRRINAIPGDFCIRFMTSHPKDATPELIDTIAACEKVCKHFHLPVQSGSDRILQRMNRHYTKSSYLALVEYAKQKIPNLSFTSDIIVGFPGEQREDFVETLDLLQRVQYDSLFTFIYSKRVGTAAANMQDPVPHEVKTQWFTELLALQKPISHQNAAAYIGKTIRVLAEGEGRTAQGYLTGRSDQFMVVEFEGTPAQIGTFVDVEIQRNKGWTLLGVQK